MFHRRKDDALNIVKDIHWRDALNFPECSSWFFSRTSSLCWFSFSSTAWKFFDTDSFMLRIATFFRCCLAAITAAFACETARRKKRYTNPAVEADTSSKSVERIRHHSAVWTRGIVRAVHIQAVLKTHPHTSEEQGSTKQQPSFKQFWWVENVV